MEEIPKEFQPFQKYLIISKMFANINKIVSSVMLHTYLDCCLENHQLTSDKSLRKYLNELIERCGDFPEDGAIETKNIAEEMFQNLTLKFENGVISEEMAKQYFVCSTLYSVLGGYECAERQDSCLFASLKIHELLRTGKAPQITNAAEPVTKNVDRKKPVLLKFSLKSRSSKHVQKEEKYQYNKEEAIKFIENHNLKLVPKVADADPSYDSILRDISHGIEMIKAGDKKRAAAFLRKARQEWTRP